MSEEVARTDEEKAKMYAAMLMARMSSPVCWIAATSSITT